VGSVKAALVWRHVRVSGTQEYFTPYLVFTTEGAWPRFKRAALSARASARAGRVRAFSRRSSIERWGYAVPWHDLCNRGLRLEPGTVLFFRSVRGLRRWFAERVSELLRTEEGRMNALERLEEKLKRAEEKLAGFKAPEKRQPYRAVKVISFVEDDEAWPPSRLPPSTLAILKRGALIGEVRERGARLYLKEYRSALLLAREEEGRRGSRYLFVWLRKGVSGEALVEEAMKLDWADLEALHGALERMVELARERGREDIVSHVAPLLAALKLLS
jgi:hypothetical protein